MFILRFIALYDVVYCIINWLDGTYVYCFSFISIQLILFYSLFDRMRPRNND